tara:strand:+ start:1034 stop:2125 length:1092 start_codon:yes stop_codon:yes gene_type:complete
MIRSQNNLEKKFMRLAFEKAAQNIGSTKENPSVGCVVVKDGTVISSGTTSLKGRPHAEINALKKNKNFHGSTMYVTLEPCAHYGKTSPCVNTILKKRITKVCYPILDFDDRTRNKAKKILNKKKIKVKIGILRKEALNFYKSYFLFKKNKTLPLMDAKIAISKDFFSVNNRKKWITNTFSRNKVHLIRSKYDCILSTYKSVNKDNSKLNCRIKGLERLSPTRVIIDKDLKLKKNLDIYDSTKSIKTYVITGKNNKKKEKFLKSKKVKIIKISERKKSFSYQDILLRLKKMGFSRILCESGFHTTNSLLKNRLIHNLYVFTSQKQLGKNGRNSYRNLFNKLKFKKKEKININLSGDQLYKVRIK